MNHCILMAEIIKDPELRFTSENQMAIAEMLIQFAGTRPEDPVNTLRVVAWGGLGQEVKDNYRLGDQVILEGRLQMNTIDRPEGFKEKRGELVLSRIHRVTINASSQPASQPASQSSSNVVPMESRRPSAPPAPAPESLPTPAYNPAPASAETDLDEIPF